MIKIHIFTGVLFDSGRRVKGSVSRRVSSSIRDDFVMHLRVMRANSFVAVVQPRIFFVKYTITSVGADWHPEDRRQ